MDGKLLAYKGRTAESVRAQYEIEKELALRLKNAPREERAKLYPAVYNELFQRVPDHPQNTKQGTTRQAQTLRVQHRILGPYLNPGVSFLEIGAGDCALSHGVAPKVKQVFGLEVSTEIPRAGEDPANFTFVLSDGVGVPLDGNSVDVAFSWQVIEHIHPDDATGQLREIFRVLKPEGIYLCVTPNRLIGPGDVSIFFDREAQGLHLKEYSVSELAKLFKGAGFRRVWVERLLWGTRRVRLPIWPMAILERLLETLPWALRVKIARTKFTKRVLDLTVGAQK